MNSADAQKNTVDAGSADAASATATGAEIVNGVVVAKENDWVREGDFYKLRKKTAPESTASEAKAAENPSEIQTDSSDSGDNAGEITEDTADTVESL